MKQQKMLLFFLLIFIGFLPLKAQELDQPIPLDPNVKIGKLENGLTYYIRHNEKPEKRLELRLVVNAGSILEDEDQLGLAHFTEHMGFNGSKNFDKNELVSYLQSVGVKFGGDLNAYTSFDETVYILPIPSDDEEIVKKGFTVLEDWAGGLNFDHAEIDKERGVVLEEYRLGRGADQRMLKKNLPVIYKGSRYAERLPIGTEEVLKNFEYETIKRFYKDWYRPDLMAVVAIGDLPVEVMEQKIKDHFSGLKMVDNPRERKLYPVPDHKETYVTLASDKESPFNRVTLYYKKDPKKAETLKDVREGLVKNLYSIMISERFDELRQKANPPYIFAGSYYGGTWARTKDAYQSYAMVSETGIIDGLKALVTENKRINLYGFTAPEFERAKKKLLTQLEKSYNERDKTESSRYIYSCINHFLEGAPMPGIEYTLDFAKKHVGGIALDEVNQLSRKWITPENRVVAVTASEKEGVELPTEEEILAVFDEVDNMKLEPYTEEALAETLMERIPAKGTVVDKKVITEKELNITELTLSNGVKVILKPTDFKNDEILMSATSKGGQSLVPDADHYSASYATQVVNESGVAEFSKTDLTKMLSGKIVRVFPYISMYSEGFSANSAPKDLEQMLQLVHLYFTSPRQDEEAFESFKSKNKALYANLAKNPNFFFQDQLSRIMSQNHPRAGGFPTAEELDLINFDKAHSIFKERFADASDFTFFFVGNFDEGAITPLLETYLGSLPSLKKNETYKDLGIRPPKGIVSEDIFKGEDEKSMVAIRFTGETAYDERTAYQLKSFSDILTIKLIEILREEKGGVYGVGASSSIRREPYEHYSLNISFPCGPENVEPLIEATLKEIERIKTEGPSEEDLNKIKETQRRDREVKLKENRFWLNVLEDTYTQNQSPAIVFNYEKYVDELTAEDIKNVATKFARTDNYATIKLYPQGYVKPATTETEQK